MRRPPRSYEGDRCRNPDSPLAAAVWYAGTVEGLDGMDRVRRAGEIKRDSAARGVRIPTSLKEVEIGTAWESVRGSPCARHGRCLEEWPDMLCPLWDGCPIEVAS